MVNGKDRILKQVDLFNIHEYDVLNQDIEQNVPSDDDIEKWTIDPYMNDSSLGHGLMQSDLFNVEQIAEDNQKIKDAEHDKLVEDAQKQMTLPYFENPANDNELLMNYQHDFITNKDMNAWGKLLELSFIVAERIVKKECFRNRLPLDEVDRDEKTSIAVEYVLRRYKKNVGWYVKSNFISALKKGVEHAIYYQTKKDAETDSIETVLIGRI